MSIRCVFGHDGVLGTYNAGLFVGRCYRCNRWLVRGIGGRWYQLPRGVVVRWRPVGTHAAPAPDILARARRETPVLQRLRRPRHALERYYS